MQIEAVLGDITTQEVDAIVNAANQELVGGDQPRVRPLPGVDRSLSGRLEG